MAQRMPIMGDWDNGYDNTIEKSIDIWDVEKAEIQNCIAATEFWAEFFFPGGWSVNVLWQEWWERVHPVVDEPEETPA